MVQAYWSKSRDIPMTGKRGNLKLWFVSGSESSATDREEYEGRLIGTVLHKSIELLLKYGSPDNSRSPDDNSVSNFVENIVRAAWVVEQSGENGLYDRKTADKIQNEAIRILKNALLSDEIRELLIADSPNVEIQPEVEIMDEKGRIFRIDLLRINSSSHEIEVVEFKTHATDDFKAPSQLKQYVTLIKKAFGADWKVNGFIVFLDPPKTEKLQ